MSYVNAPSLSAARIRGRTSLRRSNKENAPRQQRKPTLTHDEIAAAKQMFLRMDENKDGSLDSHELSLVLKCE